MLASLLGILLAEMPLTDLEPLRLTPKVVDRSLSQLQV